MENEDVNQDTNPEEETETPTNEENESEELEKSKEYGENQKIRAEKAEKELKALKKEKETPTKPEEENQEEKSNEPDYAKLAFLEGKGVDYPDDQKIVQDEAKRLNLPLTDILNMEHIKSKLKDAKDQREASEGMPKGKGKSGGGSKHDVEYHVSKGTTPDDLETAKKKKN